jgi:hypothetical protein
VRGLGICFILEDLFLEDLRSVSLSRYCNEDEDEVRKRMNEVGGNLSAAFFLFCSALLCT